MNYSFFRWKLGHGNYFNRGAWKNKPLSEGDNLSSILRSRAVNT